MKIRENGAGDDGDRGKQWRENFLTLKNRSEEVAEKHFQLYYYHNYIISAILPWRGTSVGGVLSGPITGPLPELSLWTVYNVQSKNDGFIIENIQISSSFTAVL